ncbi:MAG: hypothetical protein Q9204_007430 [Flavoplaca sp. TL-2023a]
MQPTSHLFLILQLLLSFLPTLTITAPTARPLSHTAALSTHTLSSRAPSTHLPGGWTLTLASTTTFTPLPPAATALNAFYRYALSELFTAGIETVSTRVFSISDETFELLFRIQDRYAHPEARVEVWLVRAFVAMMKIKAQRGLTAQFKGWLKGPGGVVVDVVLETIPARALLDSAMDIYGDP